MVCDFGFNVGCGVRVDLAGFNYTATSGSALPFAATSEIQSVEHEQTRKID